MSHWAGWEAIKQEALFFSGQLILGGSSALFLNSLSSSASTPSSQSSQSSSSSSFLKTKLGKFCYSKSYAHVLFWLTVQGVGYQAFTAYERGKESHFRQIVSGTCPVLVPPDRPLYLRLFPTGDLINHLHHSSATKYPSSKIQYIPLHIVDDADSSYKPPISIQRCSVIPIHPEIFYPASQLYANQNKETKQSIGPILYINEPQVEDAFIVPNKKNSNNTIVLEASVCTTQATSVDYLQRKASIIQKTLTEKFSENFMVMSILIDWTFSDENSGSFVATKNISSGENSPILKINGCMFALAKLSNWLDEVKDKEMRNNHDGDGDSLGVAEPPLHNGAPDELTVHKQEPDAKMNRIHETNRQFQELEINELSSSVLSALEWIGERIQKLGQYGTHIVEEVGRKAVNVVDALSVVAARGTDNQVLFVFADDLSTDDRTALISFFGKNLEAMGLSYRIHDSNSQNHSEKPTIAIIFGKYLRKDEAVAKKYIASGCEVAVLSYNADQDSPDDHLSDHSCVVSIPGITEDIFQFARVSLDAVSDSDLSDAEIIREVETIISDTIKNMIRKT